MRKPLSILITAALLAALSGCAADKPAQTSGTPQTSVLSKPAEETAEATKASAETEEKTSAASEAATVTSETAAMTSETAAITSEAAAVTSETAAATSEAATATSETTAMTSEAATATSEAAIVTSEAYEAEEKEEQPASKTIYEAENARLYGALEISSAEGFSGGRAVENFGTSADYICFDVEVLSGGMYDITVAASGIGSYKENNVIIDGEAAGIFKSERDVLTEATVCGIYLSEGEHEIRITPSWGWIKLDCISIAPVRAISDEVYRVSDTLINDNSDEKTKKLFAYLCDSYGKYILSGQVCDGGYNGAEFSAIRKVTGKTPAILGLDFMDYTPSRTALGASSNAVEAAIEFSELGGIVTFCWHWNAPTEYLKDGRSENGNPRWWGGFYTENSSFDIAKVMNGEDKEGKALIDRDIEEIAGQLKRLEEAGVSVLWRPLHEASGGWFWWGARGADAYKKLWIYLYEELTYRYECNNLIWVFNGQDGDWYPGDEYVDIIGEDIYPGERVYSPQMSKFKEAVSYSSGGKLVALTENGCVFDIERAVAVNAMWGWFCTWGGEFAVNGAEYSEKYTEKSILQKAYSSEYVITLDELPEF